MARSRGSKSPSLVFSLLFFVLVSSSSAPSLEDPLEDGVLPGRGRLPLSLKQQSLFSDCGNGKNLRRDLMIPAGLVTFLGTNHVPTLGEEDCVRSM